MTIIEAINQIDSLKPNSYSQSDKVRWLSRLDGKVQKDIINTHEGGNEIAVTKYDEQTRTSTELLIPHPYDEAYILWLEAQIDYANGEYAKYNNSITTFNEAYEQFERFYNRTHMPKGKCLKFF